MIVSVVRHGVPVAIAENPTNELLIIVRFCMAVHLPVWSKWFSGGLFGGVTLRLLYRLSHAIQSWPAAPLL
jgi:hypothetical protein